MNPLVLRLLIGSAIGIIVGGLVYPRGKNHAKYVNELVSDQSGNQHRDDRGVEPDRDKFREGVSSNAKSEHGVKGRNSRAGRNSASKLRPANGRDNRRESDVTGDDENAEHEQNSDASGDHDRDHGGGGATVDDEPADSPADEK